MWNSHISNKLTDNLVQYFFSNNETQFYIGGILRIECFENDRVTCVSILLVLTLSFSKRSILLLMGMIVFFVSSVINNSGYCK